jgi:hypothetical protein
MAEVRKTILRELAVLDAIPPQEYLTRRRAKYRHLAALAGRFPSVAEALPRA